MLPSPIASALVWMNYFIPRNDCVRKLYLCRFCLMIEYATIILNSRNPSMELYQLSRSLGSIRQVEWIGEILSAENRKMLYLGPGMAHGFCVLSDEVDFFYKVTADYAPEMDRGFT